MKKEIILLHLSIILFSLAGVVSKLVTLPAILITLGRVVFSVIFLSIGLLIKKESIKLNSTKDYGLIIIAGIIMTVHWFTFLESIQISTVAIGTITFSTFPLFVTFLEPLVYHEPLKLKNVILALIMLLGVLITVDTFSLKNQMTLGIIIGMISSLSYAILGLFNRYFSSQYRGQVICFYEQGIAALVLLPSLFIVEATFSAVDLWGLAFIGIICTAIAHSIYVSCLKHVKVQTAGIVSGMESIYGIVLAFILLQEMPGIKEIVGCVVIFGVIMYQSMLNK